MQTVPHITNAIIEWVERVSQISVDESREIPEICIVEVRKLICFYRSHFRYHEHFRLIFNFNLCFVTITIPPDYKNSSIKWIKN